MDLWLSAFADYTVFPRAQSDRPCTGLRVECHDRRAGLAWMTIERSLDDKRPKGLATQRLKFFPDRSSRS
jgi:hypothetical protein